MANMKTTKKKTIPINAHSINKNHKNHYIARLSFSVENLYENTAVVALQ